jgi:hypothetical protein
MKAANVTEGYKRGPEFPDNRMMLDKDYNRLTYRQTEFPGL